MRASSPINLLAPIFGAEPSSKKLGFFLMKYHIIAFGCQFNKADAEKIARLLEKKGYKQSPTADRADLVVILVCSVRQKSIDKVKNQISRLRQGFCGQSKNQKIILTGCILPNDKKMFEKMGVEITKFNNLDKIKPKTGLVIIGNGCNNFCSYCAVPYTRGREKYRQPKKILCEANYLIKKGAKEITLIAQNVNSYKHGKTDFADLLKMVNDLPGYFKIRFLTNHPKDMTEKLIEAIAQCDKIKKAIHLPFQAGDNAILKKMNRKYTREQYLKLVEKIKKQIPNVILTTDIIVGFPGETKKQFEKTVEVMKKVGFKQAFVAKYSPREGTTAYKLKDSVPLEEKKRREQICLSLF